MEKFEFYYEEECKYTKLEIGGLSCLNCPHFKGIDFDEFWVKCKPYSNEIEVEKLTEEIDDLKNQIEYLTNQLKKGSS